MKQRIRHEDCPAPIAGYLTHESDWIGRTVERCEGCGLRRVVVARVERRRGGTPLRSDAVLARREEVFVAVPVGREHAATRRQLMALTGMAETPLRDHLRVLASGRRIRVGHGTRTGRGSGQREMHVYWREA